MKIYEVLLGGIPNVQLQSLVAYIHQSAEEKKSYFSGIVDARKKVSTDFIANIPI
jgi:hypothetical protein